MVSHFSLFQSKIIQILDPQFVADQVVDATLSNKAIIMLPWWTSYLIMLKVPFLLVLVHSFNINVDLVCFSAAFGPLPCHDEALDCIWVKLLHGSGHHCHHRHHHHHRHRQYHQHGAVQIKHQVESIPGSGSS